jgi:hypothetical protein
VERIEIGARYWERPTVYYGGVLCSSVKLPRLVVDRKSALLILLATLA